jgi:hypothetical protein
MRQHWQINDFIMAMIYLMRTADKTFITEVLFIDWLQTQFIQKNYQLCQKANYDGPIILPLDGYPSHVTLRVLAYVGRQKIIIQLVPHSSHITQPLDLCVFSLFKMFYKREQKTKKMKGETHFWYFTDHNNSNGPVEFDAGRISPQSEKSLGFTHCGSERGSRPNSHTGDGP